MLMLTAFYSWRNKLQIKNYVRQVDSKGSLQSRVLAHSHHVGEGVVVVLWNVPAAEEQGQVHLLKS